LLTAGTFDVSTSVIAAWVVFAVGFAAGIPPGNAAVARRQSREVFVVRVIDLTAGVLATAAVLALGWTDWAPAGAGAGMLLGAGLLLRLPARAAPAFTSPTSDPVTEIGATPATEGAS
jgi:hypothetical protein